MNVIMIVGKQSSGKKTLARQVAFSNKMDMIFPCECEESDDMFAVVSSYGFSKTQTEMVDENGENTTEWEIKKEQTSLLGFYKSDFSGDSDVVIYASPRQIADVVSYLGRENVFVVYKDNQNAIERRRRGVGKGDDCSMLYYAREDDEAEFFDSLDFDLQIDDKGLDTTREISLVLNGFSAWKKGE